MFTGLKEEKSIPENKYRRISYNTAQANPEYLQIFTAMFNEQAARLVQRKWRAKHGKEYKGKY